MAYDPKLAERVRQHLAGHRGVTEKAMFGGLAYLLDGKMFCGVLGDELLARVGPDAHDAAMARPHVRIMDFTGRPMRGYVFVGAEALGAGAALARWVDECERHAGTLPDKPPKRAATAATRRAGTAGARAGRKSPRAPRR